MPYIVVRKIGDDRVQRGSQKDFVQRGSQKDFVVSLAHGSD